MDGAGSTWSNSGEFCVAGYFFSDLISSGTLNITNGGAVGNTFGLVGLHAGSGTVVVSDPKSTWTNRGDLCVGCGGGTGTVTQTGGTVSVAGTLYFVSRLW